MAENFDIKALNWDNEPRRVERAEKVSNEIRKLVPISKSMEALEYGCGTGLLSLNLQPFLKSVTLADSSDGMLSVLEKKIEQHQLSNMHPVKLDLTKDPLPDKRYDIIYTLMTLHHIIDIDYIIRIFSQLLNQSGFLCISDLVSEDGSFHGEDFHGHNGFDLTELSLKLERAGFGNVSGSICYEVKKENENGESKTYPVFLMVAQKN